MGKQQTKLRRLMQIRLLPLRRRTQLTRRKRRLRLTRQRTTLSWQSWKVVRSSKLRDKQHEWLKWRRNTLPDSQPLIRRSKMQRASTKSAWRTLRKEWQKGKPHQSGSHSSRSSLTCLCKLYNKLAYTENSVCCNVYPRKTALQWRSWHRSPAVDRSEYAVRSICVVLMHGAGLWAGLGLH